jgi:hypothetical protein
MNHPSSSIPLAPRRQKIVDSICKLYSGNASEEDMQVYAEKAIYDDPWSYCDTRYKIAGQWYGKLLPPRAVGRFESEDCTEAYFQMELTRKGIPKIMATSRTFATEIVSSMDKEIVFKLRQEYRPKLMQAGKAVNSLVSLALEKVDGVEKVVYHKDMWNEKDYSHEGLGKVFKSLNGDHLTKITQPSETL